MKKQYKAPLTEVVKINAEQMICQSITVPGSTDGSDFTPAGKNDEEFDENFW